MSFSLPSVPSVVAERLSHIRKSSPVSGPGSTRRIERFKTQVRDLNNRPYKNDGSQESWRYKQDYARLQRKANKLSNSGVAPRFSRLFSCLKSGQSAKLATKENTMKEVRQTLESIGSRINGKEKLSGSPACAIHKPVDENGDVFFDALEYFTAPEDKDEFFDVWEDDTASVDSPGSAYDSVSTWSSDSKNLLPDPTAALEPAGADALTHTDDLADQRSVSSDGTGTTEHNEPSLTKGAMQPVSARGGDTGIAAGKADRQTVATRSLDGNFFSRFDPEYKPVYQDRRRYSDLDVPRPIGGQELSSGHSKSNLALNANSETPAPASLQHESSSRRSSAASFTESLVAGNEGDGRRTSASVSLGSASRRSSASGNDFDERVNISDENLEKLNQKYAKVASSELMQELQAKGAYKKTLKSAWKGVKGFFSKASAQRTLRGLATPVVGKRGGFGG